MLPPSTALLSGALATSAIYGLAEACTPNLLIATRCCQQLEPQKFGPAQRGGIESLRLGATLCFWSHKAHLEKRKWHGFSSFSFTTFCLRNHFRHCASQGCARDSEDQPLQHRPSAQGIGTRSNCGISMNEMINMDLRCFFSQIFQNLNCTSWKQVETVGNKLLVGHGYPRHAQL